MRKIFLLLVGILFVIVLSCERTLIDQFDSESVRDLGDMKALTEAAHQHYKKDLKKKLEEGFTSVQKRYGAMKSMSRSSSSDKPKSIKSYGLWNRAVTVNVGGTIRTEVPLSYSQRVVSLIMVTRDSVGELPDHSMLSTIFDRLVIFHNKDGFTQKIIRFHPDRSYLDQHNFDASHNYLHKLDKDFSGYLEYLEVTGERKAIIRVVNGKPVRKYRGLNRQNEGGQKAARIAGGMTVMSGYEECIEVCEDIYGEICVGNPANPDDPGDVVCQDILIGEDCYMDCHWVEEPEPDFCEDPANWEICFGEPNPGDPGSEIVVRDKEPATYVWRDKLSGDFSGHLARTTPQYITGADGKLIPNPEAFNCHYHTFGTKDPNAIIETLDGAPKWVLAINLKNWTAVESDVHVGDIVMYFGAPSGVPGGWLHSGIVTAVDGQGYATEISSKMGEFEIITHHPRDIPEEYGGTDPTYEHDGIAYPSRVYYRKN